jgi:hypothetical protein
LNTKWIWFTLIHTFLIIHSYDENWNIKTYTIWWHKNDKTWTLNPIFNEPSDKIASNSFFKKW